ncbi:MAG: hypothetical protein RIS85_1464, partial [Pseudomonadota bacterium]
PISTSTVWLSNGIMSSLCAPTIDYNGAGTQKGRQINPPPSNLLKKAVPDQ